MLDSLRTVFVGHQGTGVHYECRNCGHTVEEEVDECPACGTTEIVRYEFR